MANSKDLGSRRRYGIAEWYGKDFSRLKREEIRALAGARTRQLECPFQPTGTKCHKAGGVCSFRLYEQTNHQTATPVAEEPLVALCPRRFYESNKVFRWVGEELLGTAEPNILSEIPFLLSSRSDARDADIGHSDVVGRIDMVLVNPDTSGDMQWCALEMQAVYFSGPAMSNDLNRFKEWELDHTPWPTRLRRPDYRSSGPKRLMPQLQIKVPTISRWGKKMAVVVDRSFWNSLAPMSQVQHVSNCDIAWFVVDYNESGGTGAYEIVPFGLFLTTLERAVEGLTGGFPTSLAAFENAIRDRL